MELVTFIFAAGETKRFERAGRYLEVIEATDAIDISLTDASGAAVDYAIGALSGLYMEGAYASVTLKSATAQTVRLLITEGRGGSRRQPGIVVVTNSIGVGIIWQEGPGTVALGFTSYEVLAPAANVRGVLIRKAQAYVSGSASGTAIARLIAAPVAPAAEPLPNNPEQSYTLAQAALVGVGERNDVRTETNYQLPAGWGIWVDTTHSGVAPAGCGYSLAYELR